MVKGVEIVRTGSLEFPPLPLWNATHSPLQLSDWLLLTEPIVADLSTGADVWWKTVVQESKPGIRPTCCFHLWNGFNMDMKSPQR